MLSDSLVESFRSRLEALGLELADLRIGGTQARPLVQVRIEWPPGSPAGPDAQPRRVTVADCATASRLLGEWLDAGGPLGRRYMVEVARAGGARAAPSRPPWGAVVGRAGPGAGGGAR